MQHRRAIVYLAVLVAIASGCVGEARTATPSGPACTGSERQTLRDDTLLVGSDLSYPPFAFRDPETGELTGFDVELMTALAERNELEVRFVAQSYPGLVPSLLARRFDVIAAAMPITDAARDQVCFSEPYLDLEQALVVNRAHTPHIEATSDLDGLVVAVQASTAGASWARDTLAGRVAEIRVEPTPEDLFRQLSEGAVHAVVVDVPRAAYEQRTSPQLVVVDEITTGATLGIAGHPEHAGVVEMLNQALRDMRIDGSYDQIHDRWLTVEDGAAAP